MAYHKIIIGGTFSRVNQVAREGIARLNADGSLDTSFNPATGGEIYALLIQADGKIIIGGSRVARLNADGSLDTTFTSSASDVYTLALQNDGKVIIGGRFISIGATSRRGIARLNADGSVDTSFNPGTGITSGGAVNGLLLQGDKVIVGGQFSEVNGTARSNIARLNADGSLDTSFTTSIGSEVFPVKTLAFQGDGKIVVGGSFFSVNSTTRNYVARLNADGSLDTSFSTTGVNNPVNTLKLQGDGKIVGERPARDHCYG